MSVNHGEVFTRGHRIGLNTVAVGLALALMLTGHGQVQAQDAPEPTEDEIVCNQEDKQARAACVEAQKKARTEAREARREFTDRVRKEARDAARAEIVLARAELAEAARNLARIERSLVSRHRPRDAHHPVHEEVYIVGPDGEVHDHKVAGKPHPPVPPVFAHPLRPKGPRLGITLDQRGSDTRVMGLTPGSGAEKAGIQPGDKVISVNGMALSLTQPITVAMEGVDAGDVVPVTIDRDGEPMTFDVETSDAATIADAFGFELGEDFEIEFAELHGELAGLEQRIIFEMKTEGRLGSGVRLPGLHALGGRSELTANHDGLASIFGTGEGVIVLRIDPENTLSLEDGDVVLKVNGESVARPSEFGRQMLNPTMGETVALQIMRDKEVIEVEGKTPEQEFLTP